MRFIWKASTAAMYAAPKSAAVARRTYQDGKTYDLSAERRPSEKEVGRYHALVSKAWDNMPEDKRKSGKWTKKRLRAYALVQTEWCHSHHHVCTDHNAALKLAGWITALLNKQEEIFTKVEGNVLRVWIPMSQRVDEDFMTLEEWRASVEDVIQWLADHLGTTKKRLEDATRKDAS